MLSKYAKFKEKFVFKISTNGQIGYTHGNTSFYVQYLPEVKYRGSVREFISNFPIIRLSEFHIHRNTNLLHKTVKLKPFTNLQLLFMTLALIRINLANAHFLCCLDDCRDTHAYCNIYRRLGNYNRNSRCDPMSNREHFYCFLLKPDWSKVLFYIYSNLTTDIISRQIGNIEEMKRTKLTYLPLVSV